jgi:ATP-dependent exoDNAse (exonuclease V) beta subunit
MSGIPNLTIVPAGAGSGKTYKVQETLADWIQRGLVQPQRVVAVTFTRSAANDMRQRIRSHLLGKGMVDAAVALGDAWISTIHGFGLRLLKELAFDAGITPHPTELEEAVRSSLVRRSLARSGGLEALSDDLARYGFRDRWDPQAEEMSYGSDVLADTVGKAISKLRSIGGETRMEAIVEHADKVLRDGYGPTQDGELLTRRLEKAVERFLKRFPQDVSPEFSVTHTVQKEVREGYWAIRSAGEKGRLGWDWALWASLCDLKRIANTRVGKKLPYATEYDEFLDEVEEAASRLAEHPGPLEDAAAAAKAVLGAAHEGIETYQSEKRRMGALDFADMLSLANEMVGRPGILEHVAGKFDCLVIDEFQDTNPLEFDLLWKIHRAGVPALIVGDSKQAIMSVQDADHRLFGLLQQRNPDACDPLTNNWRTSPALMEWMNAVSAGLFPATYQALVPRVTTPCNEKPLEVLVPAGSSRKHAAAGMASRVAELLRSGEAIWDRRARKVRSIRGGDIALLCPSNPLCERYAAALRESGIPTRLAEEGWHSSEIVQWMLHALTFVDNPADRHAQLYLAVTWLGQIPLEDALRALLDLREPAPALLEPLRKLSSELRAVPVADLVTALIDRLDLMRKIACFEDAAARRSSLLRLVAEAQAFDAQDPVLMGLLGYHGKGAKTFLAWLSDRCDGRDRDDIPTPRPVEEDAVTVSTWHKSKGLEWPVVALCATDYEWAHKLPKFQVGFGEMESPETVLDGATLDYIPAFDAADTTDRFLQATRSEWKEEVVRMLYVALTRAREKLVLEWHGKAKPLALQSLLSEAASLSLDAERSVMRVGATEFPVAVYHGAPPRDPDEVPDNALPAPTFRPNRRVLVDCPGSALPRGEREQVSPSRHDPEGDPGSMPAPAIELPNLRHEQCGPGLALPHGGGEVARAVGTAVHRCFEVLGNRPDLAELLAPEVIPHLGDVTLDEATKAIRKFRTWFEKSMGEATFEAEVPFVSLDEQTRSVVVGTIDLLVKTPSGYWIVDHKTDHVGKGNNALEAKCQEHAPQLELYRKAVERETGRPVLGMILHWVRAGVCSVWGEG